MLMGFSNTHNWKEREEEIRYFRCIMGENSLSTETLKDAKKLVWKAQG